MKDWDDLQTILALGRAGTMKDAANALGVSETTIARRLRRTRCALFQAGLRCLLLRFGRLRWARRFFGAWCCRRPCVIGSALMRGSTS